jgi:hypothetical protein
MGETGVSPENIVLDALHWVQFAIHAKGKVERPFRTVKEMHETLYHFHQPKDEEEANAWLMNFLVRYNAMEHRSEPHSRMEDWLENLPASGVRAVCSWERTVTHKIYISNANSSKTNNSKK